MKLEFVVVQKRVNLADQTVENAERQCFDCKIRRRYNKERTLSNLGHLPIFDSLPPGQINSYVDVDRFKR